MISFRERKYNRWIIHGARKRNSLKYFKLNNLFANAYPWWRGRERESAVECGIAINLRAIF